MRRAGGLCAGDGCSRCDARQRRHLSHRLDTPSADRFRAETRLIRQRLRPVPVEGLGGVVLYSAHPGSRLSQLADSVPYWAFRWAGGLALCAHVLAHPELVVGRRVLDLGAGSGIVGIVAARAGAAFVAASETDRFALAALALNAGVNKVAIELVTPEDEPPTVDLVLAGDVFYSPEVASAMLPTLAALAVAGREVLVGDPFRRDLPLAALDLIAEYQVRDMGDAPGAPLRRAGVFRFVG